MLAKGLTGTDTNSLVTVVAAAVLAALIVVTLYFGRDVFVPVALSILLAIWDSVGIFNVTELTQDFGLLPRGVRLLLH